MPADPRPRTLVVDGGCTSCPFFFHDDAICEVCNDTRGCTHPMFFDTTRGVRSLKMREISKRPKWCPLNQRPVLVTLAGGRA